LEHDKNKLKQVRADQLLTQKKYVPSRTAARELILAGKVAAILEGKKIKILKTSQLLIESVEFEISGDLLKYVSRAGFKLDGALEKIKLDVDGFKVLDVGQSTGGFSDCLLQRNVSQVVGVDVGNNQLHRKIKDNSKVLAFEGLNARDLANDQRWKVTKFNLVVVDLSFISLTYVLGTLSQCLDSEVILLALVKPQFEVGHGGLDKNGLVKDPLLYPKVKNKIIECAQSAKWNVIDYFESSLVGKDGNREFFIYACKP
jgi:23S rRNA (cytidine1920-2'-O)/16S rRNA (cytidine1409-2'-O)-methyltransferase